MTRILVADKMDSGSVDALRATPGFEVSYQTGLDEAALVKAVPGFDAVVVRGATKITRPVIEAAQGLKIVVRAGIGLDNVDRVAAKEKSVTVANTPSATSITVAEHTFGLMLGAVRHHGPGNLSMKQHKWEKKLFEGIELYGKTLGIIGFGRIGHEVAKRAIAFGMTVLAYDIVPIAAAGLAIRQVPLDELLAAADVITLHVPKTPQAVLGPAEFAKMKAGVVIVNVARGGVVDEAALLAGLESGKVRAAALDVFSQEPPVDWKLIDHPRVTAVPHLGAASVEGQERAGLEVVRILKEKFPA